MTPSTPQATHSLYTIGYEGETVGSFVDSLRKAAVRILIDVRELPLSRKRGFSKRALEAALAQGGIEYISARNLGSPRDIRDRLRANGDYPTFFAAYREHLLQQPSAIEWVASLVARSVVCLMCYEADPGSCHRSIITDELATRHRLEIAHL